MKYIVDGIEFNSDRIVNPDDADPEMVARYGYKGYILQTASGNFGLVMAIVFAEHLEEALNIAADEEFLDAVQPNDEDVDANVHTCLGNYGNYYDLSNFGFTEFDATKGMEVYAPINQRNQGENQCL